ncbi:MAG TPA: MoxR family ATPase [Cytophagaceae bacterium]|jgi:MoxR-like ATPase|nr:MoxR family ATPase [Cytophagaceae bacterium]
MENTMFENRVNLTELAASVTRIKEEVGKIIVGQHKMVDLLIAAILADGHVLIEGVPGVAKTLTAKLIAKTISVQYSRIQFTPDLMPSDVLGTSIYNLKTSEFNFKKGPIFSNIVLIDEINRAPAKTQSALFEVMEERQITMDGTAYIMERPFMILATQNPVDQEGTYRLPEAQLDRFIFKVEVDYPNPEEELAIIAGFHSRKGVNDINGIQPVLSAQQIDTYRQNVKSLHIEPGLMKYISQIVTGTRNNNALYLGASPRASLAIMTASKAIAAMRGRDFVTPEDIQEVVFPVLNHRIMLTPEKEMEGVSAKDIIEQIIKNIEIPR